MEDVRRFAEDLTGRWHRAVVGHQALIERMLVAVVMGGHVLLEGVPGTAKTLAVKAIARCLGLPFGRIQLTPDLLPADLLGTSIWHPSSGEFRVRRGPIFTTFLLADEINRAPARTQSALLEAMEEHQVTLEGDPPRRRSGTCWCESTAASIRWIWTPSAWHPGPACPTWRPFAGASRRSRSPAR